MEILDSSEILRTLQACYTELDDGRATNTLQEHETIMLTDDSCFYDILHQICSEILQHEGKDNLASTDEVLPFLKQRGFVLPFTVDKKSLMVQKNRVALFYTVLTELQVSRLAAGKILQSRLRIRSGRGEGARMDELSTKVQEIGRACGVQVSGSAAGAIMAAVAQTGRADRPTAHLLMPSWQFDDKKAQLLSQVMGVLNEEYSQRRKVLLRRLDVTIQAFQQSAKATKMADKMAKVIASIVWWKDPEVNISLWSILSADSGFLDHGKVSSKPTRSAVKSVLIGNVPDRGGVPEGYTIESVARDIVKANASLAQKDAGGKGGKSTASAAALSSVRANVSKVWLGADQPDEASNRKGKGKGKSKGESDGQGGKSKGGSYYGNKSATTGGYYASLQNAGEDKSSGGYYASGGSNTGGGGGGYYASGGGGGGGYYASGAGGGGGGYYASGAGSAGGRAGGSQGAKHHAAPKLGKGETRSAWGGRQQDQRASNTWNR